MVRVAVKALSQSDLSFFAQHVRDSKQKAINLNSDVLVDEFYPGLRRLREDILIRLVIVGPGGARPHALARKIVRTAGSKNWRLNGEVVADPQDQLGRYDRLREGDLGVLVFEGDLLPAFLRLVLVSQDDDAPLHAALRRAVALEGRRSMREVSQHQLVGLVGHTSAGYVGEHPLEAGVEPDSVEDALYGVRDVPGRTAEWRGLGPALGHETLLRQIRASEEVGRLGEEVFASALSGGRLRAEAWTWVSATHARSAFDFVLQGPEWTNSAGEVHVDVKSTRGPVDAPIHLSMAELRWAAACQFYHIARVYELSAATPRVRILDGVQSVARELELQVASVLPVGVRIDSISLEPSRLRAVCDVAVPFLEGLDS